MSLDRVEKFGRTIIAFEIALVFAVYIFASYAAGKHSADRWWQADEAKKIQTVWGIAGQSIWYNAAPTQIINDTDKFSCPGKGPKNAQELAWWRAHATPEHPCPKEQPKQ